MTHIAKDMLAREIADRAIHHWLTDSREHNLSSRQIIRELLEHYPFEIDQLILDAEKREFE